MIEYHGRTDIGMRRSLNEDTIFADGTLFVVCDGMGGHKAGEVASLLAVEAIKSFVKRSEEDPELTWPFGFDVRLRFNANRLRTAIRLANHVIVRKAASSENYTGMGTTVAAALISPGRSVMTFGHVGDSRIYALSGGEIVHGELDDLATAEGVDPAVADMAERHH